MTADHSEPVMSGCCAE